MEELNQHSKLKVLHLLPIYLPNSQIWLYNILTNTPNTEPVVAAQKYVDNLFAPGPIRFLMSPLQDFGGIVSQLVSQYTFKPTVMKRIKRGEFNIVHAHFSIMGWAFKEAAKYGPLVTSFYGFDYERLPHKDPTQRERYKELFKIGSLFLCEGEHGKQTLIKLGCPEEKIVVNPLGMRVSDIPVHQRTKQEEELNLLQVAPFREKKGQIYTVRAFAQALKRCPNMKLTLIGNDVDGSQKQVVKFLREQKMEEHVKIYEGLPYKKLHEVMAKHQVFIHPSCYGADRDCEGGAPMVLIDAQATGMPIISTTHCDIPAEVIDGKTGLLTSEKDVSQLTDSIIRFYKMGQEEYKTIATNAREHVAQNFDAVESGKRLREIYQTLLT